MKMKIRALRLTKEHRTAVIYLIDHGMCGWLIAKTIGCTIPQVYAVAKAFGMGLTDYRRGETVPAEKVIQKVPFVAKDDTGMSA